MNRWFSESWREKLAELRQAVQDAVTRWFRWKRADSDDRHASPVEVAGQTGWRWPAIEVEDDVDRISIVADVPGLEPSDLHAEVVGNYLVLRGEKKRQREESRQGFQYSECWYGAFTRWISLPVQVVPEKAKARYRNGRLVIELPKATPARRVPIEVR